MRSSFRPSCLTAAAVVHLEAELSSFDGGDVAAGPRTHHGDICIDCRTTTQQQKKKKRRRIKHTQKKHSQLLHEIPATRWQRSESMFTRLGSLTRCFVRVGSDGQGCRKFGWEVVAPLWRERSGGQSAEIYTPQRGNSDSSKKCNYEWTQTNY